MNSKELAQAANELLRKDGFWKTEKKKDSRPVVNGRKRRPSRKQKHTK